MSENILEMRHIYKSYGGIKALKDVNLELKKGEVLCLCGENGAGKSTLMKILAGVEKPTSGEIFIDGRKAQIERPLDAIRLGISMVHQELVQIEEMTVAENIFVGRYKANAGIVDGKGLKREAEELMDRLGIHFPPDSLVRQYSVAQRQLIEILKALSYDASIIIFDEPTAALTTEETENLYQIIRKLREEGIAVILISHRMEDIFAVGDRVEVLRDGEPSGSLSVGEATVDGIVRMMIGRQPDQQFPDKTNRAGDTILEVRHLTNGRITDISFELKKGEILGVAGLVGAGRTELLRAIFGVDACEGELILEGVPIKNRSPAEGLKRGFALVPEDRKDQGLILEQSILQNLILSVLKKISAFGIMSRKKSQELSGEYIEKLNIRSSGSGMMVRMLSGGNQQKVVLGKCLASSPSILLLDEPTRGVDVGAKAEIYRIINELAADGLSIIVVSSEMTELLGISDRILVMHEGYLSGELKREEATEEAIMKLAISHFQKSVCEVNYEDKRRN